MMSFKGYKIITMCQYQFIAAGNIFYFQMGGGEFHYFSINIFLKDFVLMVLTKF